MDIVSETQLCPPPPPTSRSEPLVGDERVKMEAGGGGDGEIVNVFPATGGTPAVPASQEASRSHPNELFTSTAADQNRTSKSWLEASILPGTLRISGLFGGEGGTKKKKKKKENYYYSNKHFSSL